jgi:hypothetical protein
MIQRYVRNKGTLHPCLSMTFQVSELDSNSAKQRASRLRSTSKPVPSPVHSLFLTYLREEKENGSLERLASLVSHFRNRSLMGALSSARSIDSYFLFSKINEIRILEPLARLVSRFINRSLTYALFSARSTDSQSFPLRTTESAPSSRWPVSCPLWSCTSETTGWEERSKY